MRGAVQAIVRDAGIAEAQISVAVVDDTTIARLHKEFLGDPDPTDVLSFLLERSPDILEGEVVVSAETARAMRPRGTLHGRRRIAAVRDSRHVAPGGIRRRDAAKTSGHAKKRRRIPAQTE